MIGKLTAVIYDLDSTLADTRHRWHLAPREDNNLTWVDYSGACMEDKVIRGTAVRMQLDWQQHELSIASGRGGESFSKTEQWLDMHALPYDYLVLRGIGDERANSQIKVDHILSVQARGVQVVLVYEDHPAVGRDIIAATGVPVLGVNPFYEEFDHKAADRLIGVKSDAMGGGL